MQNVTFEDNTVFGEPAGDEAVAVDPSATISAEPRLTVTKLPFGSFKTRRLSERRLAKVRSEVHVAQQVRPPLCN